MKRIPLIAGNWKMYKTTTEAIEFASAIKRNLYQINPELLEIVICPAFTALSDVSEVICDSNIKLGAQDVHWEREGAFTGEVSILMLKDLNCKYVIVGHSERRTYFKETNEIINKKLKVVLKEGLSPILCVGENLEERENNMTFKVLDDHIYNGLKDISSLELVNLVIAYEPVWAIGTGKTATPQIAQEAQGYIRNLLNNLYGESISQQIRILYGGSVKPDNIRELIKQPDIDGALVGGASLILDSFVNIVKYSYDEVKNICMDY
ncbi:MAG: triose-phosphate isomerase [Candidatus Omnitrophica bacterium]|nr:triose-phosphate isomerase [Candidatus Omnitrophota bacterium]